MFHLQLKPFKSLTARSLCISLQDDWKSFISTSFAPLPCRMCSFLLALTYRVVSWSFCRHTGSAFESSIHPPLVDYRNANETKCVYICVAVMNEELLLSCCLWVRAAPSWTGVFWSDLNWMTRFPWQYILSGGSYFSDESPVAALDEPVCLYVRLRLVWGCESKSFKAFRTSPTREDWIDIKESVEQKKKSSLRI